MIVVCALLFEALPLIEHYRLKRIEDSPFVIYQNPPYTLIISGIGAHNISCAIGYIAAREKDSSFVNFGIAGSSYLPIGALFMPSLIQTDFSQRIIYPSYCFKTTIPLHPLTMKINIDGAIEKNHNVDMESYAFFEAAKFFTPLEQIHAIKCISDHGATHHSQIQKKEIHHHIHVNLPQITQVIDTLTNQRSVKACSHPLEKLILKQLHFTQSQQIRLKQLLIASAALSIAEDELGALLPIAKNAKDYLHRLNNLLDRTEIDLSCFP